MATYQQTFMNEHSQMINNLLQQPPNPADRNAYLPERFDYAPSTGIHGHAMVNQYAAHGNGYHGYEHQESAYGGFHPMMYANQHHRFHNHQQNRFYASEQVSLPAASGSSVVSTEENRVSPENQPSSSPPGNEYENPYMLMGQYVANNEFSQQQNVSDTSLDSNQNCQNTSQQQLRNVRPRRPAYEWMQPRQTPLGTRPANGKTRTKDKYRVVYSDYQRKMLELCFTFDNKYITIEKKKELAAELDLTDRQIKNLVSE